MTNKNNIIKRIIKTLEEVLETARDSVARAHATATHKENVAENKYDTLGLEASYLAHGQAKRVAECEADLKAYQNLKIETELKTISLGALITLINESEQKLWLFLGPKAGGVKVKSEEIDISIITASSPLGKKLLGCVEGDEFELKIGLINTYYYVDKII
jgi:transcription elongation GreA/GreB family factor